VENLVLQGNAAINGTGNGRANTIQAGAGNNLIDGGGGLDTVDYAGASAAVTVSLAPSTAQATGGSGTDTILHVERLSGSRFDDTLSGNALANVLRGGSGADSLAGGAGNDTLVGGPGNDTLSGSQGADVFLFESATGAGNVDDIVFFSAVEDTIHLDRTVFAQLAAGTPLSDSQLLAAPGASAATAAGQRIIYDTSTGALYYDADGNASGFGAVRFAILDNHPALTAADILVVP
jgi:Ca2+-binding RTX toxin-like protein